MEYLILPSYNVLAKKIAELMPSKEGPQDFFINESTQGTTLIHISRIGLGLTYPSQSLHAPYVKQHVH